MSRSAGAPPPSKSGCAATSEPAADTSGTKTSPAPYRRVRACRVLRWALEALLVNHLSMTRIAAALDVAWNTANIAGLSGGQRLLIDKPGRLDNMTVVGADEHAWRHTRRGDNYVTVVIDLTPASTGSGPSRLLAMVEGRSKQAFKTWLSQQPQTWRDGIRIVAMGGFTGFKTAATEELPKAATVMGPFHVIRLAGDALYVCRRVQVSLHGTRGRNHHPLYPARRTLHTGTDLLTDTQLHRLDELFADDKHVEVEATWGIYQTLITAYRNKAKAEGKKIMTLLIAAISTAVLGSLVEVAKLGRTLTNAERTSWRSSTPATAPPRPSTGDWDTFAAQPSASATSPATPPVPCSRLADSAQINTLEL